MSKKIYEKNPDLATVQEATDWLRLHAPKGVICPCCKQFVKIYKRSLNSAMARWLIWLVRTWEHADKLSYGSTPRFTFDMFFTKGSHHGTWVDVKRSPVRGGDYAKLIHWGLVEHKSQDPKDTKRKNSGLWRPTFKGFDFVMMRCSVPSHVYIYDNILLKSETTQVTIVDALGTRFDYKELMNSVMSVQMPV